MDTRAAHALVRFGLGRLGNEPVPADPAAWLRDQLKQPDTPSLDPPAVSATGLIAFREDRRNRDKNEPSQARALYQAQGGGSLAHAVATRAPYRERLVWFWTNHFTVSLRRPQCAGVLGAYVEEAIRPHVTGRFEDMVLAVISHPAMIIYLDNGLSTGPNSAAAKRGKRGLNENLARECLELHTVSPAAGYTQADVTSLAMILTGWTLDFRGDSPGFRFSENTHEPGSHSLLGRTFPPGYDGGVAALRFLANHAAAHRFIAGKLVRHFVADAPPESAIRRIEGVLRDTRGDLGAAAAALVGLEEAWAQPGAKFRSPTELLVASYRATGGPPGSAADLLRGCSALGQPLWNAPAPDGWPDQATAWASPEGVLRRVDWAYAFAGRVGQADVLEIARTALGPALRDSTRVAMANAGSRRDAMTLFLTSPEFQRR